MTSAPLDPLQLIMLMVILAPAVILDLRSHRIPNAISLGGWVAGLALGALLDGWGGFVDAGLGLAMLLGLTIPFFFLGWMGAGDVKLIAAIGAIIGQEMAIPTLLSIVFSGLAISLAMLLLKGELANVLKRWRASIGLTLSSMKPVYISPPQRQQKLILPYALPIAIGTTIAILVELPLLGG